MSCVNLSPNSTCSVSPASASLNIPSNIQVAVSTGVGSASKLHRASIFGWFPWPVGLVLLIVTFTGIRRGRLALRTSMLQLMLAILLTGFLGSITACGDGGGFLGPGNPNPLPVNATTPPGVYTVTIAASAGGITKSVALTVQVQ